MSTISRPLNGGIGAGEDRDLRTDSGTYYPGGETLPVAVQCSNCSRNIPPTHPCITELARNGTHREENLGNTEPWTDSVSKVILKVFNPVAVAMAAAGAVDVDYSDSQLPKLFLCSKCGYRLGEMYKFYQMFLDLTTVDSEVSKILRISNPEELLEIYSNGNSQSVVDLDMDSPQGDNGSMETSLGAWNPLDLLEVKLDSDAPSDSVDNNSEKSEPECIIVPDTAEPTSFSICTENSNAHSGSGRRKSGIPSRKPHTELSNRVPTAAPTASSLVKRRKIDHTPPKHLTPILPKVILNLPTPSPKVAVTAEPPGIITLDSSSDSDSVSSVLQLDDFELVNVKTDPEISYLNESEVEEIMTTPIVSSGHKSKRKSKIETRPSFTGILQQSSNDTSQKTVMINPSLTVNQPVDLLFDYPYDLIAVLDPLPQPSNSSSSSSDQVGQEDCRNRKSRDPEEAKTKKRRQFKCPEPECTIVFPTKLSLRNHLMSAAHNLSMEEAKTEAHDVTFDPDSGSDSD